MLGKKIFYFRYLHIHLFTLMIIWLGLFMDGLVQSNQLFTNILVVVSFAWVYYFASKVVKQLMLFGLIVALGGEVLFALVFGMYTYRLENLPLYVPFGHSLIYASVYYILKEPLVKKNQEILVKFLYISMVLYSALWFIMANDTFGFICTLTIVALLRRYPTEKLFFLFMFFVIVYLELIGTHYGCWHWPEIWFNKVNFVSSANPPSGISVFYFGFDLGCLWLYKHSNKKRWNRMKILRAKKVKSLTQTPENF